MSIDGELREAEARAVADLVAAGMAPVSVGDHVWAFRGAGGKVELVDAERFADRPRRLERHVSLATVDELMAYVGAHLRGPAEVWAEEERARFWAILDAPAPGLPTWASHGAIVQLQQSPEWVAWSGVSGKLLPQEQFAEFVEDRAADIVRPESAVMLEIAQSFHATNRATFESSRFLDSGRRALEWRDDGKATAGRKGELEIPATIDLGLAPWVGVDRFRVVARLRYRINEGALTLGVKLVDPEAVIRAAFRTLADWVRSECEVTGGASGAVLMFEGRP